MLARTGGLIQVGAEPPHAVVLSAGARPLLAALDGFCQPDTLAAYTGLSNDEVVAVLAALGAAGLLESSGSGGAVVAVGQGALFEELCRQLAGLGIVVRVLRHGVCCSVPDLPPAALVVLALGTAETDRAVTDTLTRTGRPFLLVDTRFDGVRVGPLVEPRVTPCRGCLDRYRRDRDPNWPMLAAQLTRLSGQPSAALRSWAVATAATEVLAYLADGRALCRGATIELIDGDWLPRRRRWPAAPDCPCGSAGQDQTG